MPSLRIAVRSVGISNIGLVYQQPSQHKSSDAIPENLSVIPDTTPMKSNDTIPIDQTAFCTSTPTRSIATNVLPVDLDVLEEKIDTGSSSESSASIVRTRSMASIDSNDSEDTEMNATIIEQYQILPDRVWEYR